MSDANEISLNDVAPIGQSAPIPNDRGIDPGEMDAAISFANGMKQQGISDEDVEGFLGAEMASRPKEQTPVVKEIPISGVTPLTPAPVPKAPKPAPTFLQQANDALVNLGVDPRAVGEKFLEYGRDISNVGGEIGSYITNFSQEHETREPGKVTPEEEKAARLMGIPMVPGNPDGGFYGKLGEDGTLELHHPPIYKMSPKEIQALNDHTLEGWGLDPRQERERAAAFAEGRFAEGADPVANITSNNAIGNWIQDQLNPKMAASKQYAAIQDTVQAQSILDKPSEHTKEEVQAAQSLVDYYKGTVGKGVVENTKELLAEIKKNPGSTLAKFAASLEADPELLMLGKARVGTLLTEAKIATLSADLKKAQEGADLARRIYDIDYYEHPELLEGRETFFVNQARKIHDLTEDLKGAKKAQILGNVASEPVIGGLANVALDREAQTKEKGYISPGSELTPLAQGAALGTVAAGGESLRLLPKKGEIPVNKVAAVTGLAAGGAAVGAALNSENPEQGAKEGVFLPLLSRVMSHGEGIGDITTTRNLRETRLSGMIGSTIQRDVQDKLNGLVQRGVSPVDIWQKTGHYQDAQGNWYRELPDDKMEIKRVSVSQPLSPGDVVPISQFVSHPELEAQYPELWKNLKVEFVAGATNSASFDPNTYTISVHPKVPKGILAHEIQHAIQTYEGLPGGASPRDIRGKLQDKASTASLHLNMVESAVNQYKRGGIPIPKDLQERYEKAVNKLKQYPFVRDNGLFNEEILDNLAFQKYQKVMGEVQAETARARTDYTPKMRETMYPGNQIASLAEQWDAGDPGAIMKSEIPETNKLQGEDEHVRLAAAGNQRSVATLYNHYMPRLTRVMNKYMRQAGPRLGLEGEDIAQRAFFKAIQALPEFKGGSSFYTWLYSIGRNEALNAIAESKREVPTESIFKASSSSGGDSGNPALGHIEDTGSDPIKASVQGAMSQEATPEAQQASQQISQIVRQTIATLPKNVADVLRLREVEGLTDVETARALNMNVGTVRVYNQRGKEYLARAFRGTETENLFKQQGGFADPELLKRLAKFAVLAGGGAAFGANYFDPQHPYKSMIQGAVLGLMSGQVKWGNLFKSLRDSMHYSPEVSAREQLNQYDWDIARGDRLTASTRYAVDQLVKTGESRVKITQHLDGDKTVQLTPAEQKAADIVRQVYDEVGQEALRSGVLNNFLENYINHEWKPTPAREKLLADLKAAFAKQSNMSTKDRHALARKFTSLAEGKAAGLEPVSEDVNVLLGTYIDSITRAMANKNLLDSLRTTTVGGGKDTLVMPAGRAPYSYVPVAHSQLARYRVHPSVAPSLEFLYHTQGGGALTQGIESLNTALKRVQVSLSLFHAKSLIDAAMGAMEFGHPIRNLVDIAQSLRGKDRGQTAYLTGGMGDDIDHLIRALKITPRRGTVPVEDVTSGFYEGLKTLQDSMDSAIKGSGKYTVGGVVRLSKALDHLLWENLHSGLKLVVGMNALERLRRSYARDYMKNPNVDMPTTAELADRAASFTNDVFGGLNWRRLADDAKTQWGYELGKALANPTGRRISQFMMFAPDWTYSTVRSVVKAIGKGSGFEGLLRPKEIADLHRLYLIRSAFIYATLYNGINMALSGHPIWDNKRNGKPEPFLVDLGNGEWAQANKHAMEVPNLVAHPAKWAMGKLGNIPSEVMEQALGKEYLSPDYMPPMKGGRVQHAAKRLLPFSGTSYLEQGPKEAISSALGVPIYGHVQEENPYTGKKGDREKSEARKAARRQKKIDALLGEH